MRGRVIGLSPNYSWDCYEDEVQELIGDAYYDTLPPDAFDLIDEDEFENLIDSNTDIDADELPSQYGYEGHQRDFNPQKFFAAYFNLGVDCRQIGDRQGAIEALSQALRIDPNNAHAYYYRGVTKTEVRDYIGAIIDFKQAIQINPNYFNAYRQQAEVYYNLGKKYQKLNYKQEASQSFRKAAEIYCTNNQAKYLADWTPFELGESNREEAIPYLINYLYQGKPNEKRLATSAIGKLCDNFEEACNFAVPYLINNLFDPAPQVRSYTLKALNLLGIIDSAVQNIRLIADNDSKDYNRNKAKSILNGLDFYLK